MNISIFGLGYVGCVSLGCLAQSGHSVIGIDSNPAKVELINKGRSPIVENDLDRIINEQRGRRAISATVDVGAAVRETDVSFICVGTPSTGQGHLNLENIFRVARDIGEALAKKEGFQVIVVRSTVLPGTSQKIADILEKNSGKRCGRDFSVVANPEFLREGMAVSDYLNPSYTLIGSADPRAIEILKQVYENIDAPVVLTETRIAETIKYVNNSYHALKIAFANEIGSICKALGIDSHNVMEIFCLDTKLNISPSYLKPGFAYGGSCLPKDLRALCAIAHDHYLKCPVLTSVDASNEVHKGRVLDRIIEFGKQKIGFFGLSFKEGTDDLRNSPIIDVLEKLIGKGFDIRIYDRNVILSQVVGSNREFILQRIPFISRLVTDDADEVVSNSELIVVVNKEKSFRGILERIPKDKIILDLVNLEFAGRPEHPHYHGISW